jgi:hypothetical protein
VPETCAGLKLPGGSQSSRRSPNLQPATELRAGSGGTEGCARPVVEQCLIGSRDLRHARARTGSTGKHATLTLSPLNFHLCFRIFLAVTYSVRLSARWSLMCDRVPWLMAVSSPNRTRSFPRGILPQQPCAAVLVKAETTSAVCAAKPRGLGFAVSLKFRRAAVAVAVRPSQKGPGPKVTSHPNRPLGAWQ